MESKIQFVEPSYMKETYIKNSRAIAVLWAIFTICYAIITTVVFMTPEWIGTIAAEGSGKLGLWQICYRNENQRNCQRRIEDIFDVPSNPFQVATIFVAISVVTAFCTMFCLILTLFVRSTTVFFVCGWIQCLSAICFIVGCVFYPFGWNSDDFRKICGPSSDRFDMGQCGIRWAYPLATIGCIDGCILSTVAFFLSTIQTSHPGSIYQSTVDKGEINHTYNTDAASLVGSRKSLNLQPVLLVVAPHDDTVSQFSSQSASRYNRPIRYSSANQF